LIVFDILIPLLIFAITLAGWLFGFRYIFFSLLSFRYCRFDYRSRPLISLPFDAFTSFSPLPSTYFLHFFAAFAGC